MFHKKSYSDKIKLIGGIPYRHALGSMRIKPKNNADKIKAYNLLFRGGPCNYCRGNCFSLLDDYDLIKRLQSNKKLVGTFISTKEQVAEKASILETKYNLHCWIGHNTYDVYVIVATNNPDLKINGKTVAELSFCQDFIDENWHKYESMDIISALYSYPKITDTIYK